MQLVVITKERFFDEESKMLNSLFERGLEGLHLRKPGASDNEMRDLINKIDPDFHGRIIIHGHAVLYGEFGLWGVHFPLAVLLEMEKMGHLGMVSCSAHTYAEVAASNKVAHRVFVSPMFDSISKKGYMGNVKLLHVPKPKGEATFVALGGITPERLAVVRQHGFEATALMGYIWEGEPLQRFEACRMVAADLKTTGYAR